MFTIDAAAKAQPPETGYLQMGGSTAELSPGGQKLTVNSRYLMLDGKPWLPVMGEFHYSRYPSKYWEEEILKMKAGGVKIISTYIFWIHHEEIEGKFDWSGRRDLRKFIELCGRLGMYVYPRIGPWAHGEARNGGFPDWLIKKCRTRVLDSTYLFYVQRFYDEIGRQLKGRLWKDGGPVIGIQIENEYSNRSPEGGAAYISKLKSMAIQAGLDVPLYTITGWDNAVIPPHIVIPVFGGYPDEPWSGSILELPPDPEGVYQFHVSTPTGTAGIMQGPRAESRKAQLSHYPKFTAEIGGGMEDTYHRRVVISGDDIASMAMTALGSGDNLLGYYMFHGGTNPDGKLTTLQESQATGYPNDVPIKSYDFQAPLREFGQMNSSFRRLKIIHRFISDFGSYLAPMTPVLPDIVPSGPRDTTTLRIAARTAGNKGFIFFNNYLRNYPLPEQKGIQVVLKLPSQTVTVPRKPADIPSQSYFFWPVNMDLNGADLIYATAQPLTELYDDDTAYYFFIAVPGISADFVFEDSSIASLHYNTGKITHGGKQFFIEGVEPSRDPALVLKTKNGRFVRVILLSQAQAYNSWKINIDGTDHLFITGADLFYNKNQVDFRSRDPNAFSFSVFPPFNEKFISTVRLRNTGNEGVFKHYSASVAEKNIPLEIKQVREPQSVPPVKMGIKFNWRKDPVATVPDDSTFGKDAGVWQITIPPEISSGLIDVYLEINYTGDIARLYDGDRLLDDNFYNGTTWEVGLNHFLPGISSGYINLKIFPLRKDAPVYIRKNLRPDFYGQQQTAVLNSLKASPEYKMKLIFIK